MLAGAFIGAERQKNQKLAGVKTHALVALGACLFTILGIHFGQGQEGARVVGQVASGVGFLGAGAIIKDGLDVRGLTTAATIWCAAAVGCLSGAGMFKLVAFGAVLIVVGTIMLRKFSKQLFPESEE
jgi:putative Mg2+ transporter-C (MgtC) family protein